MSCMMGNGKTMGIIMYYVALLLRSDYVSPGEMQKILFARLFYHKPSFASK